MRNMDDYVNVVNKLHEHGAGIEDYQRAKDQFHAMSATCKCPSKRMADGNIVKNCSCKN